MAITLIVNNTPFEYPEQGEQQPWGEAATGWAAEVTNVLASLKGPADILESFFDLSNNQSVPASIPGFSFDSTTVRSFQISGNILRSYNPGSGVVELTEEYTLTGLNTGSDWLIQREGFGEVGVSFDITSSGQVQYTSTNIVGASVQFRLKFRGTAILK